MTLTVGAGTVEADTGQSLAFNAQIMASCCCDNLNLLIAVRLLHAQALFF